MKNHAKKDVFTSTKKKEKMPMIACEQAAAFPIHVYQDQWQYS